MLYTIQRINHWMLMRNYPSLLKKDLSTIVGHNTIYVTSSANYVKIVYDSIVDVGIYRLQCRENVNGAHSLLG